MTTWVTRHLTEGEEGLKDRACRPAQSPGQTPAEIIALIEDMRRERRGSARRIWQHLITGGCDAPQSEGPWHAPVMIALRTVGRGAAATLKAKRGPGARVGYTYLHSAVDGFSRLAYTEALEDESAATTISSFAWARAFFTAQGSPGWAGCPEFTRR